MSVDMDLILQFVRTLVEIGLGILDLLVPFFATATGVFLGIRAESIIETERTREYEIFHPLLGETSSIADSSPLTPIDSLVENEEYSTVIQDIPIAEISKLHPTINNLVQDYLETIGELEKLDDDHWATAVILDKAGYSNQFYDNISEDVIVQQGIGLNESGFPDYPGPWLVVGEATRPLGGHYPLTPEQGGQVKTKSCIPLYGLLLTFASLIYKADSPEEFRSILVSHPDVNEEWLDSNMENWHVGIWEKMQSNWAPPNSIPIETLPGGSLIDVNVDSWLEGDSFISVAQGAGVIVQLQRISVRRLLIKQAEELAGYLAYRTSLRLYNPNRYPWYNLPKLKGREKLLEELEKSNTQNKNDVNSNRDLSTE